MFQARTLWKAILNARPWLWNMFGWTSHINVFLANQSQKLSLSPVIGIWKKKIL